jgi:hypothetical protein
MIALVPSPGEAIAFFGSLTVRIVTQIGVVSMVVHAVCFALMSEQASVRRKAKVLTVRSRACIPAGVWPQVGIQVLAVGHGLAAFEGEPALYLRENAFLLGGWVTAVGLVLLGAVVKSILVWFHVVERVTSGLDPVR